MITYDLSGKTALVTGSNRGIGKAMADALEDAGAKVVRTSSKDCDLSDRKAVYDFIERVKKEHQIDILVNNAGMILRKPAAEHPDEWWDKVMSVNIDSQFVLARTLRRRCPTTSVQTWEHTTSLTTTSGLASMARCRKSAAGRVSRARLRGAAGRAGRSTAIR